jgi:PAS domain S-box-containing protein
MTGKDKISDDENGNLFSNQQLISDYFPGVVYIYDTDNGQLSYVSKKITDLLGYSFDEVKSWNKDWMQMVFADDVDAVKLQLEKYHGLQDHETHSFDCRYNFKGNGWRYFRTQGSVLRRGDNGKPASLLFIAQDITHQLQSEDELKKSRELMKDVEHMLEFGTWNWDFVNNKIERSAGIYALMGYDGSTGDKINALSVEEQYSFFLQHLHPEDRERLDIVIKKSIEFKEDYEIEYRLLAKNGEEKIIHSMAKAVKADSGVLIKMIGIISDVTRVTRFRKEIESYVAELNRSNKELEEFAYVASHDLQEPLRKIITFSDRLQNKFGTVLSTEGKTYLSRMMVATENMRMLIDNLLEFSRITRNSDTFTLTDLNTVMEDARLELELKIEETGAVIEQQLLPSIVCNSPQIKQLFVNLLSNSLKFRKPGTQTRIRIGSEAVAHAEKIKENLSPILEYYKIAIEDNGIGFEKEYADRIFQIFQRLHGKSEYPGSGIGLAICKKIVDQHNGIIKVDSSTDKGSVFTVFLPVQHP